MHRRLLASLLVIPLVACAGPVDPTPTEPASSPAAPAGPSSPQPQTGQAQWTITVVRHAEPAPDGTADPPLAPDGQARAERLATRLEPQQGVAVLASPYQRAQQTATPTALAWGVPVETYDPAAEPEELLIATLTEHPSGSILIVGHSNTAPGIVSTLCGCDVGEIDESEHGLLYEVTLDADGNVLANTLTEDY